MTTFEFSGHRLDLHKGRLQRGGNDVDLRAKSLLLLTYLLQNAGRVISKDELVNTLWPNTAVSDDSLTQCMKDIRRTLGPDADGLIRTVLRRGYIIDEDRVRRIEDLDASAAGTGHGAGDAPSIAVLPFENLSGDPTQDYFADCQSARKVDPGSASKIDPPVVRNGERPTGWSWSGLRSPVGRG